MVRSVASAAELVRAARAATSFGTGDRLESAGGSTDINQAPLMRFVRGSVIAERYVILDELGAGTSGVVYSAFDRKLDRKLALKFVRTGASEQAVDGLPRLLREGQSLARLSHPNVVAVYDVGAFQRHSYIAMELIEGLTLRQWLVEQRPSWKPTLAVFLDAARGLLAAHNAGLVHRDFKPDNVLIAAKGRVCVSDFGLSHMLSGAADPLAGPDPAGLDPYAASLPSTIAGTPAYMAPEQYRGQPIDGRADQFSFCAALYEALYGVRPFAGSTAEELMRAVCQGEVRPPPPRGVRVPSFLQAAVLRGLRPDPQARYPSMVELCDVLSRGPQHRRVRLGAGVAAALVLVATTGAWQLRPRPCHGSEAHLRGVWDGGKKQGVQQAFEKTGLSYAPAAWLRLSQQLDSYAERWVAARTEACQAAIVRREISPALLDQRTACLEQRLHELRITVDLLGEADAEVVERADKLTARLRRVEDCSSAALLTLRVPPPSPEIAAQVKALRQRLAEVAVLEEAGRFSQGMAQARAVSRAASALGYRPLLGEAGLLLGALEYQTGDPRADETLRAALHEAESSQDDTTVLAAWLKLSRVALHNNWEYKRTADYVKHAEAFATRLGTDRERAEVFALQTKLHDQNGQYRESTRALEQGLASTLRAYGPDSPQAALFLSRLGTYRILAGETERGLQDHKRALALAERTLGPTHPSLVLIHDSYGIGLENTFQYQEAVAEHRRALQIAEQLYPETHPLRQHYLLHVAYIELFSGHFGESEALSRRLLAADERAESHNQETVMTTYEVLALSQHRQGHRSAAIQTVGQGLERLARFPEEGYFSGLLLSHLGSFEREAGLLDDALAHSIQAVTVEEKLIPTYSEFGQALTALGMLYVARGEPALAIPHLERALRISQNVRHDVLLRRGPHFALAQALVGNGGNTVRAYELAEQSRDIWQRCGSPCSADLAAVTKWLQKHIPQGA